jgi:hypothetical protein
LEERAARQRVRSWGHERNHVRREKPAVVAVSPERRMGSTAF